jgi:hypothetical protein
MESNTSEERHIVCELRCETPSRERVRQLLLQFVEPPVSRRAGHVAKVMEQLGPLLVFGPSITLSTRVSDQR